MELGNSTVKTPEAETETPTRIQPVKGGSGAGFSNGVLKRHAPLYLQQQLQLHHHPVVVTYKECLKNHAASLGGHAVDGCGEFMPAPASHPAEPGSLKCAACGCHRNFHRRDPEDPLAMLPPPPSAAPALEYHPHHRHHPPAPAARGGGTNGNGNGSGNGNGNNSGSSLNNSPSPPPISSSYYPSAPHMLLALSHGLSTTPDGGHTHTINPISAATPPMLSPGSSRKRYRTKFTQFQKDKMLDFAEKLDWKMQKRDEDSIHSFCGDIGVDKGVFKVWMHNNKNTFGKKDHPPPPPANNTNPTEISTPPASANGNAMNYTTTYRQHDGSSNEMKEEEINGEELGQLHLHDNRSAHSHALAMGTNGSSSSS